MKPPSTTLTHPGNPILIPEVSPDQIEDTDETAGTTLEGGLVSGLGKLNGELLVILDARQLLPALQRPHLAAPVSAH